MRIVAGRFGGRIIAAPAGNQTRPTTDRVREAMMSAVLSALPFDLSGCEVLDLFAGSGALGLELLSRGAAHATFVEKNRGVAHVLQKNIDSLKLSRNEAKVVVSDAFVWVKRLSAAPHRLRHPYHLVVLDPPYALDAQLVLQAVETLIDCQALVPGALVLFEHAQDRPGLADLLCQDQPMTLRVIKTKRMGSVAYDMLEVCKPDDADMT